MSGWVAIGRGIGSDPKTHALAEATGLDIDAAIGKMVRVFAAMSEHAVDGDLAVIAPATLELWANWHGRRGRFATAFLTIFTSDGVVTAWERYNGAKLRKAERDRVRLREKYQPVSRGILARENGESRASLAEVSRNSQGYSTEQNSTGLSTSTAPLTKPPSHTHGPDTPAARVPKKGEPVGFGAAWAALPARDGGNPRRRAVHAFAARIADGHSADVLLAGAQRYAAYCAAKGTVGSQYVQQGATFFGPDCAFLEPWTLSESDAAAADRPLPAPAGGWLSPELDRLTDPSR